MSDVRYLRAGGTHGLELTGRPSVGCLRILRPGVPSSTSAPTRVRLSSSKADLFISAFAPCGIAAR